MAGSGSLSAAPINSTTIDCNYSVTVSGSGRQAIIDIVNTARTFFNRVYLGAGHHAGTYRQSGLVPNTSYHFYLYDWKNDSDYTRLASAHASTPSGAPPPPPPPPPHTTSGTLSGVATGAETASLNYSYANGTNVSLFRGTDLLQTFGSGNGSGVYEDSGLTPEMPYTYYLRNGATVGSTLLASAMINTPELPARGTLSANTVDSANIDLTYTFIDGEEVSLFRGSTKIKTFGSGSGSGVYRSGGLTADTSYTYYLRNGTSAEDIQLATASAKTLEDIRQAIIRRGKILPLSSQITIFDSTLTRLGILEKYTYTYWNFKYRQVGDFKLTINRYLPNTEYLVKGNILAIYVAGYYRAGIIEYKEIDLTEEGKISENYIITGRGIGGLLAERKAEHNVSVDTGYDNQNTLASTAMRHYVNVNCMDADNADRNYPLLYLEEPDPEAGGNRKYDARFQVISELLEEISLASGLGWEVILDPDNKRFIFRIIEGLDRSFGNGVNSPVTFSPEYGNVRFIRYTDSNINSKNVATVAGQGEGADRLIVYVSKDGEVYTGMDRREVFIDARDLETPSEAYTNDPAAGSDIDLEMADTSAFIVGDSVIVSSSAGSERAIVTDIDTNVSITVDTLVLNHTDIDPLVTNIEKLIQRGHERLVDLGETKSIEMENLSTGPFSFGEDFYIGDILTVKNPGIVTADIRLVEAIIEIDADKLIQNRLILGKSFPDTISVTELRNKNTNPEVRR